MKKNRKWYQKLGLCFIVIFGFVALMILVFSMVVLVKAKKNPDKIPDFFGYKPMIVLSGSMEDEIFAGDLAIVKIIDPSILKEGDIIAFRINDDVATTHRIIKVIDEDGITKFVTKGDNNNTNERELVAYENVEGKYLFKLSGFGNIFMFIQKPLGLIVCLLTILVLGTAGMYFDGRKKISSEELKEFEEFKKNKEQK